MFGGMKQKLQDMQQKMEETKARLETITVIGESANGNIRVTANGNRKITNIELANFDELTTDSVQFSEQLKLATNSALEQAEKVSDAELKGVAQGIMPNIPGLF